MKLLLGEFNIGEPASGVVLYYNRLKQALAGRVDLHLLLFAGEAERSAVRVERHDGLRAIVFERGRTITGIGDPRDAEARSLSIALAAAIRGEGIDVAHVITVDPVVLEAARDSGIAWVLNPVTYRLMCGQAFFLEGGERPCSGPDADYRKCARCLQGARSQNRDFRKAALLDAIKRGILAPLGLSPLRRIATPARLAAHFAATRSVVDEASAIITMSAFHGQELQRLMGLPGERFRTVPLGHPPAGPGFAPRPDRFRPPLRFGWIHRASREWGIRFMLEAWRRAALPPERATLSLFCTRDGIRNVRWLGHGDLIDSGSIQVTEFQVLGREDELLGGLAARIFTPLWTGNGWTAENFAYRLPYIAPADTALSEPITDGVDGFVFRRGDPEALAQLLRKLAAEPQLLAEASERLELRPELDLEAMAEHLVGIYREAFTRRPERGGDQ